MRQTFAYLRAESVAEACELKAKYRSQAQFVAGGTDLMREWKKDLAHFDYAIDIAPLRELSFIQEDGDELRVGALTTLADIADATPGNAFVTCMSFAAQRMATPQLRTTATIGGNICHASPCADMAVILSTFDASAVVRSSDGHRTIPMREFFVGNKQTAIHDNELLMEVRMRLPEMPTHAVFNRAARTSVDLAQASACVCLTADGAKVARARIIVGACAPVPTRSDAAEELLVGMDVDSPDTGAIEVAAGRVEAATTPICDLRAGDVYRRQVTRVLVRRAINECLSQLSVKRGLAIQ